MRGALPSVRRLNPLLRDSAPPCCARFATSAKSRAAVTSEETKEPQERGAEREGGRHAENEGRNGTGRFIYRSTHGNRSHIQRNQVNNRTLLRLLWHLWKLKDGTTATAQDRKLFSPDLTEKKWDHQLTKTMANFSSSSVGSGMGTFRGMMWCFISDWPSTLSMFPIFNLKKKKKNFTILQLSFSTRKIGKSKLPNNPNSLIIAWIQRISS